MVVIIKKLMNVAVLMFIAVPFCSAARATIEQLDKENCSTGTYLCHFHANCCNRSTQYCSFSSYRCENVSSPYESMEETCCQALHDENLLHREGMVDTCQYNLGNMKSRWTPFCAELATLKEGSMTTTATTENDKQDKPINNHSLENGQSPAVPSTSAAWVDIKFDVLHTVLILVILVLLGVIFYQNKPKKWPCSICGRDVISNHEYTASNDNIDNKIREKEKLLEPGMDKNDLRPKSIKETRLLQKESSYGSPPVSIELDQSSQNEQRESPARTGNIVSIELDQSSQNEQRDSPAGTGNKVSIELDQSSQNEQRDSPAGTGNKADETMHSRLSPFESSYQKYHSNKVVDIGGTA